MTSQQACSVTYEQKLCYSENGYAIVRGLLQPDELQELIDAYMGAVEQGPVPGLSDFERIKSQDDPLWQFARMMNPHRHLDKEVGRLAYKYMLDARVGAILSHLIDEEPLAALSMFFYKPPGARGQDFHQDNFYLRARPNCVAAWLAIDAVDQENGGLLIAPGSKGMEIRPSRGRTDNDLFFTGFRVDDDIEMPLESICMAAGDAIFFGGEIIHGSYPNYSKDRFRRSFVCHYVPASCQSVDSWYNPLLSFDGNPVHLPPTAPAAK